MAEKLILTANSKEGIYQEVLPQIEAVIRQETDLTANLANVAAILKEAFGFFWVGFYLVKGRENPELVLAPFQGPLACTRIRYGRGVCGTAWERKQSVVVPDVDLFPGHIACSSQSRSEIVVPLLSSSHNVWGVLDIDSAQPAAFDDTDRTYLEQLASLLSTHIKENRG